MFCSWRMTFEWLTLRWCELSNSKSLLLNIFLLSAGQICALNDTKTYYICQLDSFYSLILHFSCFLVLIQLGIQGEVISRSVAPEPPHYRLETGGGNNCLILSLCQSALKWSSCHVGVTGVAETILTYRLATSFKKVVISSSQGFAINWNLFRSCQLTFHFSVRETFSRKQVCIFRYFQPQSGNWSEWETCLVLIQSPADCRYGIRTI